MYIELFFCFFRYYVEIQSKIKNKVLTGHTREIIVNVIHFKWRDAEENKLLKDLKKVHERIALATSISLWSVQHVNTEMRAIKDGEYLVL